MRKEVFKTLPESRQTTTPMIPCYIRLLFCFYLETPIAAETTGRLNKALWVRQCLGAQFVTARWLHVVGESSDTLTCDGSTQIPAVISQQLLIINYITYNS